ncbi:glutamine synthetase 1, mitochondrial-like [Pectinophora gossypiella]|uniref:glutamine synthetase 1, mitochondrial-like n=1 Tax=Pectinophora gossypiella TaxID=13191 RepID=UPI00214E94E0|nr:glutamine synthetase 1, mitochondrial-like [Pectinophora gossypiella]
MKMLTKAISLFQRSSAANVQLMTKRTLLKHNINHITNRKVLDRYLRLPMPCNKILATYIWIDGSGINMRCKDRILNCTPYCAEVAPGWAFDGSSCGQAATDNSDTTLKPAAVCRDPFRMEPHVLVLCEVYQGGGTEPVPTNYRHFCNEYAEMWRDEEPWFGIEQEYTLLDNDGWGFGWPKGGGFPAVKYEFSYCGVGAKYIAGRDISEAQTRACLYAGLDFEGTNAEVMFACWEFQIGTSLGMKGPDDLWLARYILARVGEEYGAQITYHPKPFGSKHPGVGLHHNFSTKKMRSDGGYQFIEECIKRLEKNHMKHMAKYSNEEYTNRMRLSGKFETAPFDKFSWGIANRKASIRLQRNIKEKGKGFMEDRRPGGDADPYAVCGLLMETCLGKKGGGGQCP